MSVGLIKNDQVEAIYVGDEQAKIIQSNDGLRLWFSFDTAYFKPVYEVVDGKKYRIARNQTRIDSVVPMIEPVDNRLQTIHYEKNTMHRGNEEYTRFSLVIDPNYYAQESYKVGYVIVYEQDGELQISRILGTNTDDVRLIEDTVVHVGNSVRQMQDRFYTWPTYDGDTGIYKGQSKDFAKPSHDEVLVIPDNWASDGYQGVIKKAQIKGVVLGYDVTQLTNTLTDEERMLFQQLQNNRTSIDRILKDLSVNIVVRLYLYANIK